MNTNRTYGIEIECAAGVTRDELAERLSMALNEIGHTCSVSGYHHNCNGLNRTHWEVQYDVSIRTRLNEHQVEIVSPVLSGYEGFRAIKIVCDAISNYVRVNASCGLHVHHFAESAQLTHRVARNWARMEGTIMHCLPPSRRSNGYCKQLNRYQSDSDRILRAEYDRYHTLNLSSYALRKTLEFRCHSGTTEYAKITNWILVTQAIVEMSQNELLNSRLSIHTIATKLAGHADNYQQIRSLAPSPRSKIVRELDRLIGLGIYSRQEIIECASNALPDARIDTIKAYLTDGFNPKYNKFRTEVVEIDGIIKFAEENTSNGDNDYIQATNWLISRYNHFQAAA